VYQESHRSRSRETLCNIIFRDISWVFPPSLSGELANAELPKQDIGRQQHNARHAILAESRYSATMRSSLTGIFVKALGFGISLVSLGAGGIIGHMLCDLQLVLIMILWVFGAM
jgi:hypothetical protein